MKRFILLLLLLVILIPAALATTPFSYQFYNSDGTAQTNVMTMEAWPRSTNAWTVYGTNIIWGSQIITLTPNASGYGTNHAYPNSYRIYVTNLNSLFYVVIPDTTNQISLGSCLVSAPQVAGPIGFFGMVTNWLGYWPSTNTYAGIAGALGFNPATNTTAGLISTLGYTPATNTAAGLISTLGYTPATNTFAAATNLLAFSPTYSGITNKLGFGPATNTSAGLIAALGYTPATNTYAAFTNILGFVPATNAPQKLTATVAVIVPGSYTNQLFITNGIIARTNAP